MRLEAFRIAVAIGVAGCFFPAPCQRVVSVATEPSGSSYESFFHQVSELKAATERDANAAQSNGPARPLTVLRVQDIVGLTDSEAEKVSAAAVDCVSGIASIEKATQALIFESRLEFIETGKHSEALSEKMKIQDDRRNELVMRYVRQLKSVLPDSAFEKLDAYVRAPSDEKKSLTPAAPKPVAIQEVRK